MNEPGSKYVGETVFIMILRCVPSQIFFWICSIFRKRIISIFCSLPNLKTNEQFVSPMDISNLYPSSFESYAFNSSEINFREYLIDTNHLFFHYFFQFVSRS